MYLVLSIALLFLGVLIYPATGLNRPNSAPPLGFGTFLVEVCAISKLSVGTLIGLLEEATYWILIDGLGT